MKKLAILVLALVLCLASVSAMAVQYGPYTADAVLDLGGETVTLDAPIWVKGGTLTVKNGTINSTDDAFIVGNRYAGGDNPESAATLIIESNVTINVTGNNCNCVYIYGTEGKKAKLITSGNLSSTNGAAIQGNGSAVSGEVVVKGGRVYSKNDTAIFHPQNDKLTITGGEIIGNVGIEIRNGELNISGNPTIATHSKSKATATANGNGSTAKNAAIAVSPHSNTGDKTVKVTISGEPEIIANGEAAAIYAVKTKDADNKKDGAHADSKISITMTSGNVEGKVISENQQKPETNEKIDISIVETYIPVSVDLPQTGDTENMMMWVALMAMACVGLVATRKMSRE